MKKEETKQLLSILQVAYPNHYKSMDIDDKRQTLALYYEMFQGVDTTSIVKALKNYIKTNKYPPTVAGLQEQVDIMEKAEISVLYEIAMLQKKGTRKEIQKEINRKLKLTGNIQSEEIIIVNRLSNQTQLTD